MKRIQLLAAACGPAGNVRERSYETLKTPPVNWRERVYRSGRKAIPRVHTKRQRQTRGLTKPNWHAAYVLSTTFLGRGVPHFLVRRQRCNKPSDPGCLPSDCFNAAFGLIRRVRCFRALGRLLQANGGKSEPRAKFAPGRNYPSPYPRAFALRAPALCEGWLASRNPGSTDDRRQRSIKCHMKYWILLRPRTRNVADGKGRPDPKVPCCRAPIGKHCLPSDHVRSPVRQR